MILVTGRAGFIGSHIVKSLIEDGHEVRVLLPIAHRQRPEINPDAELVEGDVRGAAAAARTRRGGDAICHQAEMVGLGADVLDLPDYVAHNAIGTAELLGELARRGFDGCEATASSMVAYGEGRSRYRAHGIVRPGPRATGALAGGEFEITYPQCGGPRKPGVVSEAARLEPRTGNAATKVHQEHLEFSFSRGTGVAVTGLRYHNVYRPGMPHNTPYAGVASVFRGMLEHGVAPPASEDGVQLHEFVHSRDVARGTSRPSTPRRQRRVRSRSAVDRDRAVQTQTERWRCRSRRGSGLVLPAGQGSVTFATCSRQPSSLEKSSALLPGSRSTTESRSSRSPRFTPDRELQAER